MNASGSRARAGALALALLAAAAPLVPAAAQAQGQGPVTLIPRSQPTPAPAPVAPAPEAPEAPAAPPPQARQERPSTLGGGAISVQPLDRVDVDGAGLIDGGSGGFTDALWAETPAQLAAALVAKLPAGAPSPVMHDLAVRLLTSAGAPRPASDLLGPELLAARMETLLRLGEPDKVAALAAQVPAAKREEAIRRLRLEARLLTDAAPPAAETCAEAREGLTAFDSPWWQKIAAFCALAEGRVAEAQVAVAMLRETGHRDGPFYWAAERLSGIQPAALAALEAPNPLILAMIRRAGAEIPAAAVERAQPWLLAAVADHGPGDRLAAAERAAVTGALSAEALAAAYEAAEVPADLPTLDGDSPRRRAALWQHAGRQPDPVKAAEIMSAALDAVAGDPLHAATARLYARPLAAIRPAPELMPFAIDFARALYAGGAVEAAREWVLAARVWLPGNRTAERAAAALWPYDRIAEAPSRAPMDGRLVDAWRQTQEIADVKEARPLLDRRHTLVLGLLQALGEPVVPADWQPVLLDAVVTPAPAPDAAILRALDAAAAAGHVGETVALSLLALGNEGPAVVHPEALFRAVAALKRVGLAAEARALALEALAAAGV